MSSIRTRAAALSAAAALALGSIGIAAPALAAESPEAAVDGLLDIVESGDVSDLAGVVCEAERDAARDAFDVAGLFGLAPGDPAASAIGLEVGDRAYELVSEDGDAASVRVRATLSVNVEEGALEDLVRAMLEAEMGPDDPPVSDADIELMVGFMGSALGQSQPIDEQIDVVREDGEWLVCGGLDELTGEADEPEEPAVAMESSEGLCGVVGLAAVNAAGSVQYDMSQGFETVCSYFDSTSDELVSATISLSGDASIDDFGAFYGVDEELDVMGRPAFVGADILFVEVDDQVLQVSVSLGEEPPAGTDAVSEAMALAELVIPVVPDILAATATPEPAPTPEPTPSVSLCEALPLAELNERSGLGLDEIADSGPTSCTYTSPDGDPGFHTVTASTLTGGLEFYRMILPDAEDSTVAGQPAFVGDQGIPGAYAVVVGLPGDEEVLDVRVFFDTGADEPPMTAEEVALLVAERMLEFLAER